MTLNNCDYNVIHTLHNKAALVYNIDKLIKDAEDNGHGECVEMWKKIKEDEEKHIEMLQNASGMNKK